MNSKEEETAQKVRMKICKHHNTIQELLESSEERLVKKLKKVNKLISHKNNYFKKVGFPSKYVQFKVKDPVLPRISELIENSFSLEMTDADEKEQDRELQSCFNIRSAWYCIRCLSQNSHK